MPIFDISETINFSIQKGKNTLVDSGVYHKWNADTNFVDYSAVIAASLISDPANPIDKDYIASAEEIIARYNLPANPASGLGAIRLIWPDDDPITNPFNLVGFSIIIEGGKEVFITQIREIE